MKQSILHYDVSEIKARLNIGQRQLYAACKAGDIPAERVGKRWLIPKVKFDAMFPPIDLSTPSENGESK